LETEANGGSVYASMSVGCAHLFGHNNVSVDYIKAARFLKSVVKQEPRNSEALRVYALALHATNSVKNNQEALSAMSQASMLEPKGGKANQAITSIFGLTSPISRNTIEEYAEDWKETHDPTNMILFDVDIQTADNKMMADFPKAYAQAVEDEANEDNEDSDSDEEEDEESDDSDGENSEEENDGEVNEVLS